MAEYIVEFPDGTDMSQFERIYGTDGEIIRCKDCIKRNFDDCPVYGWLDQNDDWFCPEGERKGCDG